jgi:hypothetical protein
VIIDESFIDFVDVEEDGSVADEGRDPLQRHRAQEPGQELRTARHPLRIPGREPGARGRPPAEVERLVRSLRDYAEADAMR